MVLAYTSGTNMFVFTYLLDKLSLKVLQVCILVTKSHLAVQCDTMEDILTVYIGYDLQMRKNARSRFRNTDHLIPLISVWS